MLHKMCLVWSNVMHCRGNGDPVNEKSPRISGFGCRQPPQSEHRRGAERFRLGRFCLRMTRPALTWYAPHAIYGCLKRFNKLASFELVSGDVATLPFASSVLRSYAPGRTSRIPQPVTQLNSGRLTHETSHQTCHARPHRGQPRLFPAHLCDSGRTTVLKVLEAEGFKVVALSPEESRYGSIESLEEAQKCADLFRKHRGRSTACSSRCCQLRRRARHCQRCAGPSWRARAHPCLPRRCRQHDHQGLPRLLLRQDVGLQQPASVRHQVLAHQPAHRRPHQRRLPRRPASLCRHLPCRAWHEVRPHRRHRRGRRPFNTVRFSEKLLENSASPSRRSTSPRSLAASRSWTARRPRSRPSSRQSTATFPPRASPPARS